MTIMQPEALDKIELELLRIIADGPVEQHRLATLGKQAIDQARAAYAVADTATRERALSRQHGLTVHAIVTRYRKLAADMTARLQLQDGDPLLRESRALLEAENRFKGF